ncbi:hypothetical protein [Microscilla marina]|uniref:Lipoprotein n=1 Tax=Microscilla marina ATCC 23134 TaxID=313606 RepID=A1ZX88_MICM2|nr:hypothetical protein [Microscilla marina]EAY24962.1 hypothetical protein M23134_03676 [Microscilla marina ATCC 23134]
MCHLFIRICVFALFWAGSFNISKAQTIVQLQARLDSLKRVYRTKNIQLDKQKEINKKLITNKIKLEYAQEQTQLGKDSLQLLLNAARYRESRYRAECLRLKRLLEGAQDQADSLQKIYDEVMKKSQTLLTEYRRQIKQLVAERNTIAQENIVLQKEVNKFKKTLPGLFPFDIRAVPGASRRERFSQVNRAKNIQLIQVTYRFTRPPEVNDTVTMKVFDQSGKHFPVKVHLSLPWNRSSRFERAGLGVTGIKWLPGRYTIKLYRHNHQKNMANQEVGLTMFVVKQ